MRNNSKSAIVRRLIACLAFAGFAFVFACQQNRLVEYKKYASDADVPRISIDDAKKEFDAGTSVIIDSRPEVSYKQEHIAGSLNIPFGSTDDKFSAIPKGKKIILYCS